MNNREKRIEKIVRSIEKISPYLKSAKCGFCKKPYLKHTRTQLITHFAWRDAYIIKLRTIQKMTAEDRKKLVRFINKHSTKSERIKLAESLRYDYDFPEYWKIKIQKVKNR